MKKIHLISILCLTILFSMIFFSCRFLRGRDTKPSAPAVAQLHQQQIEFFRDHVQLLENTLVEHHVKEVMFSGTMTIQSGEIPVFVAPVQLDIKPDVEQILEGSTPYAVLFTPAELTLLQNNVRLKCGSYLLVFEPGETSWNTRMVNISGETEAVLSTTSFKGILAGLDDEYKRLRERARREAERKGFDLLIVDVEIEFGSGTEFFVSFLWWRWSLIEDPPLPY